MSPLHRLIRSTTVHALILLLLLAGPASAAADPFAPVPADHWAYPALEVLGQAGLLEGGLPSAGSVPLTRYEVADLISEAASTLGEDPSALPAGAQAQVALAWLYRLEGQLDGVASSGHSLLPLDHLQSLRQLYWLTPATARLAAGFSPTAGPGSAAETIRIREQATEVYRRLQETVPSTVELVRPPQDAGLELALASRLVGGSSTPAELAARIEETSQALRHLGTAFGSELAVLNVETDLPARAAPPAEPDVVTVDDLRRSTGLEAGSAPDEGRIPLGKAGDVEAWLGVEEASESPGLHPGVHLGLHMGTASLHAGWRLVDFDFSDRGLPAGEGQAGLQLRF